MRIQIARPPRSASRFFPVATLTSINLACWQGAVRLSRMEPSCRHLSAAALLATAILSWTSVGRAASITLSDAIDRALHVAPSVDVAAAASDMSVAHVREQRAPLFPTVAAGGEYYQAPGYDEVVTNRGLSAGMLTLDYTAWDWGRRQARLRAAQYVNEASRLGVAAARAQIVFDTSVAYFDLLRARGAQQALQASLERLTRYVTTIQALEKSGRMITNDVLKFRTARDSTELALDAARSNSERAAATLGILIGEPNQPDLDIARHDRNSAEADRRSRAESCDAGGAARDRVGRTRKSWRRRPSVCRLFRSRSRPDSSASIRPRLSRTILAARTTASCRCRYSTAD